MTLPQTEEMFGRNKSKAYSEPFRYALFPRYLGRHGQVHGDGGEISPLELHGEDSEVLQEYVREKLSVLS